MEVPLLSIALCVLGFIAFLFVGLYLYFSRNYGYWKKLGVPHEEPKLFVGNMGKVLLQRIDVAHHLKDIYMKHKDKPYVGLYSFDRPILLVNDLDLVKNVLVKQFQHFTDRNISGDPTVDPMFKLTMFSLKGQEWKHVRNHFSPVFTSGKMKTMFSLVDSCAQQLSKYLDQTTEKQSIVEVKDIMARFTTDSITTCAFGLESNSVMNPESEFRRRFRTFVEYSVVKGTATLFLFFAPALMNFFRLKFVDEETTQFLRKTIWDSVKYRETTGVNRKDFIDHMMELRRKNETSINGRQYKIEDDIFVAQSFGFFFAGFETSASTMTYCLYELALHPEIQTRLREEMLQVLEQNNKEINYASVHAMPYLDMVVNETLRKYPILAFLDRVVTQDYPVPSPDGKGTITIKTGTGIYIPMLGIHRDPEYYPEPDKFDPERFTEENKQKRHPLSYFPFGEGPRICIGMRFGLMQVKIGLIHILSRYEVEPCKDTPVPLTFETKSFLIAVDGDLPLNFKRIKT